MLSIQQRITVVTRATRLQGLLQRWATKGAARFRLGMVRQHQQQVVAAGAAGAVPPQLAAAHEHEAAVAEFAAYEREDQRYQQVLEQLRRDLELGVPVEFIDRSFLPNYDFGRTMLVVVVGQDGLVANTAKYVGELPIVAVNPDPSQFDGVLLPFEVDQARRAVQRTMKGQSQLRAVTLAEVRLNDGQRMLAFNDFFIGIQGHVSARYVLTTQNDTESQSSSGLIVSTGAGSTGWFSSIFNMTEGVTRWMGGQPRERVSLNWDDRRLLWAVREPFLSRHSGCELVAGMLEDHEPLIAESLMPERGIIFSDGIESDYLEFNSGTIARIQSAPQRARLVVGC